MKCLLLVCAVTTIFYTHLGLHVSSAATGKDKSEINPKIIGVIAQMFLDKVSSSSGSYRSPLELVFKLITQEAGKEIAPKINNLPPPNLMPTYWGIKKRLTLDMVYDMYITCSLDGFFEMLYQVIEETYPDHHYKDNVQNTLKRLKNKITAAVFPTILKCGSLSYFFDPWDEAIREEFADDPSCGEDFVKHLGGFREAFDDTAIFKFLGIDEKNRCIGKPKTGNTLQQPSYNAK